MIPATTGSVTIIQGFHMTLSVYILSTLIVIFVQIKYIAKKPHFLLTDFSHEKTKSLGVPSLKTAHKVIKLPPC